jgi:hypothetical protein
VEIKCVDLALLSARGYFQIETLGSSNDYQVGRLSNGLLGEMPMQVIDGWRVVCWPFQFGGQKFYMLLMDAALLYTGEYRARRYGFLPARCALN